MTTAKVVAYIGLGSNLADPRAQVERAIETLAGLPRSRLLLRSHLYASAPWGVLDQPEFVNAAVAMETTLPARDLMQSLLAIERDAGRRRDGTRWGPRVLDLDLLLYGAEAIDEPGLRVPHPHLHERAFVLQPLAEIAPQLELPQFGSIAALAASVDGTGLRRLD